MSKLYLMVGVPASGKSTFAQRLVEKNKIDYVSRDEIRFDLIKDSDDYFSKEKEVVIKFRQEVQDRLDQGKSVIADATHLTSVARAKFLSSLNLDGVEVVAYVMKTPLAVCLERNAKRTGRARVPDDVIVSMYKSFTVPVCEKYINKTVVRSE